MYTSTPSRRPEHERLIAIPPVLLQCYSTRGEKLSQDTSGGTWPLFYRLRTFRSGLPMPTAGPYAAAFLHNFDKGA